MDRGPWTWSLACMGRLAHMEAQAHHGSMLSCHFLQAALPVHLLLVIRQSNPQLPNFLHVLGKCFFAGTFVDLAVLLQEERKCFSSFRDRTLVNCPGPVSLWLGQWTMDSGPGTL